MRSDPRSGRGGESLTSSWAILASIPLGDYDVEVTDDELLIRLRRRDLSGPGFAQVAVRTISKPDEQ